MKAEKFADAIVSVWTTIIDGPKIGARFAALEARIVALEQRPMQKWAGVHMQGTRYAEASLATRSGSLWVATKATTTTPRLPASETKDLRRLK